MADRMTAVEREEMRINIQKILTENGPTPIKELRRLAKYKGNTNGGGGRFTMFVKCRFKVIGNVAYPESIYEPSTNNNIVEFKKLIKAVEQMAVEIEALQKENQRLRNAKVLPTISERAKRALLIYGE